jgi:Zn-dependent protease with chaperone function
MDFFARQDAARKRTTLLVALFIAALAGLILSAYVAVGLILGLAFADPAAAAPGPGLDAGQMAAHRLMHLQPELLFGVGTVISLIVLGGTASKLSQLRAGGSVVAESLGGRWLDPSSRGFHERRLQNVVEEMALAAGVPVPSVYILDGQSGINAFAAGYTNDDAVIGITEGAMKGLRREELQGVVAHEFSHIINGDMRLNIRLIGILHGLLVLAVAGRILLQVAGRSRGGGSNKKGGGVALLVAIALAVMIIGYAGYFFGGLIKRAVSRQREYLADASAVQFTRNPLGLAGALKKIGGLVQGGAVQHPRSEELSHLFFADGIKRFLGSGSLFATHPPLPKRVKLLDPSFDGTFPLVTEDSLIEGVMEEQREKPAPAKGKPPVGVGLPQMPGTEAMGAGGLNPAVLLGAAGSLAASDVAASGSWLEHLPESLRDAVHDPLGAQAVVLALLIHASDQEASADAWSWVATYQIDAVSRAMEQVTALRPGDGLGLVALAMPGLRMQSREQAEKFLETVTGIIEADHRVTLIECCAQTVLKAGLRERLGQPVPPLRWKALEGAAMVAASALVRAMAAVGSPDPGAATAAREAGRFVLERGGGTMDASAEPVIAKAIGQALEVLQQATMPVRKVVLEALMAVLEVDGVANGDEVLLMRAVALALSIPLPAGSALQASVAGSV